MSAPERCDRCPDPALIEGTGLRPGGARHRILGLLHEAPGLGHTTQEIADELDLPRKSVCVHARDLHRRGLVGSTRTGRRTREPALYWVGERL